MNITTWVAVNEHIDEFGEWARIATIIASEQQRGKWALSIGDVCGDDTEPDILTEGELFDTPESAMEWAGDFDAFEFERIDVEVVRIETDEVKTWGGKNQPSNPLLN
jgi:hypothetical protein